MTGRCHDTHRPIKRGALFSMVGIVAFTGLLLGARAATATNSVTDVSDPSTYSCVQPGFLTFEDLMDGTGLASGTITGVEFTTPMFTWLVGDFDTGLYNGKYPSGGYTSQGTHWTWIGPDQGSGDIRFVYGPASVFSLLVSANSGNVHIDAYDDQDNLLESAGPSSINYNTGHMDELKIVRPTADIAYVRVSDTNNFFVVDSICTDAPGVIGGNARDHFMCYKGRTRTAVAADVNALPTQDRFETTTLDLKKVRHLCAPANMEGQDPTAPLDPDHLKVYPARGAKEPPFVAVKNQKILNEFGLLTVDVTRAVRLMVPAAADVNMSPPPLASPAVNHFVCYRARRSPHTAKFRAVLGIDVEDAFKTQILTALRPTVLCVPANVDNQQPGDQTRPNFLMCYRAKPAPGSPKFQRFPVNVTDQFGSEALTLLKSAEICVPSFKVP